MRSKLDMILLMLMLLLSMVTKGPSSITGKRGGEVLWQRGQSTLYRCGPDYEDLCFDDSYRVTKVYVGD